MAISSYRIYCTECPADTVIRSDRLSNSSWKIESAPYHEGVCPACNSATIDESDSNSDEEIPFEQLDSIGETGAANLRDAGIVTAQDVANASDEEILDVSWVGKAGLDSIRAYID